MPKTVTLALVPLDERPVNTRYPQMLGAIGGAEVLLPDPAVRGVARKPADRDEVARWLCETPADAALVSCDYLAYGNLINARISQDSAADALSRLRILEEINPGCPVHAFSLITRVANADNAVEEPAYWADWGTRFYRYARLAHQAERGMIGDEEARDLASLKDVLPAEHLADWLTRRLRNHSVNLGLMDMAARGKIESLLITSDDTSPFGFPSRERDWLASWPALIGPPLSDRLMMHPGADEVGSALVASLLNRHAGRKPAIWPHYSMPGDQELVAPYEDRPIRETVAGQIEACGCRVARSLEETDVVLAVATPSPRRTDYRPEYLESDRAERASAYARFLGEIGRWQEEGRPVALADVAYPNGSEPLLTELLLGPDSSARPGALCAYGAWNTAGNTLGTVVAQAACSLLIGGDTVREQAQRAFLAHRFLEDYGYQSVVRREARAKAREWWGRQEPTPGNDLEQKEICSFIERRLAEILTELQPRGVGEGLAIESGSVRLPWQRLFEVDFELSPA